MSEFIESIKSNWEIIIFMLPFIWWIYEFFQKKKYEVQIEKLKKELELWNQQKTLNDKKFRDSYQNFVNIMIDKIMESKPKEIKNDKTVKWMIDFLKVSLLFAWPKTIEAFWTYMRNAGTQKEGSTQVMEDMEDVIFSMREDMSVDNKGLKRWDILQTFINEDIKILFKN